MPPAELAATYHLEGQGKQPPAVTAQSPTDQPSAVSHQPPATRGAGSWY